MQIKRIYNNNVALVDDGGREVVVIGRGLCFGRRAGDAVDEGRVEKVFSLRNEGALGRFERLIESIDPDYLVIAEDIVGMLRSESDLAIDDDGILIALADHVSLALEREKRGVTLANPMLFEIKHVYRREFDLARRAAEIIHDRLGIWVSEEEVGFITLHIVNATMSERPDHLIHSIEMIRDILAIVGEEFGDRVDPESLAYERFLRHLQFFAQRVLGGGDSQDDASLPVLLDRADYPDAFACADRIAAYVEGAHAVRVTDAERSYLVYHLATLVGATGHGASEAAGRDAAPGHDVASRSDAAPVAAPGRDVSDN